MRCSERRSRRGFSLMELMIVVAITGILAAIAIPTFSGYVIKSRTSEAVQFLGVIKLKQEAYRSEFGQYLQYANGQIDPSPIPIFIPGNASMMKGQEERFPINNAAFNTLGAKPDGNVRFGYGWAAGLPTDADDAGLNAAPYELVAPFDHYFVAQAVADLDNDGESCTFEVTSFTKGVWFTPAKGWE
jgi:prepilin-type N-terminal cleavage/methylation domain-containing protein